MEDVNRAKDGPADDYDLEVYRELSGACVSFVPVVLALVGWYLPRWRRRFFTAVRKGDHSGRLRIWDRWIGVGALLLALGLLLFFLVYLELVEGEALLSSDFFTGLREGFAVGMAFAILVTVVLMAVRKVVMLVRRATPYDPRERLNSTQARRMADEEIAALAARVGAAGAGEPGRERAEEYLELARKLFEVARPGRSVFYRIGGTGAVEAVAAVVLCQVARSALEKGEPVAEEQTLCFFNPLHGWSHGTHELSLGERSPRQSYPLCPTCLGHALAETDEEVVQRMLTVPRVTADYGRGDFTTSVFPGGDTRPIQLVRRAERSLEFDARQRRRRGRRP